MRRGAIVLGVWLAIVLALAFAHAGASPETWTRLLVLGWLGPSLVAYAAFGRGRTFAHPGRTFVALSLAGAVFDELAYMISRPLDPSLLVVDGMSPGEAGRAVAIDLALAIPAYLAILPAVWWFARRYRYGELAYLVTFGLAMSLGDGGAFFIANPVMLLFAPYVMTNYWAMTFVPYLVVRDSLPDRRPARAAALLVPLVALPVVYFAAASIVIGAGRALGWI